MLQTYGVNQLGKMLVGTFKTGHFVEHTHIAKEKTLHVTQQTIHKYPLKDINTAKRYQNQKNSEVIVTIL